MYIPAMVMSNEEKKKCLDVSISILVTNTNKKKS